MLAIAGLVLAVVIIVLMAAVFVVETFVYTADSDSFSH